MKVVPVSKPVNDSLVRELEALLVDARSGDLTGMVWSCEWRDNEYSNGWCFQRNSNHLAMLGEIDMMRAELILNVQLARDNSLIKDLL